MRASQNTDGGRKKPHVFNRIMRQKLTVTLGIVMLALTALLVRTYLIQDQNNEEYSKIVLSQRQSEYTSATLPYKRGDIYDRNGNRLATSEKVYNLILDPRQMADAEGRNEDGTRRRNVVQPTINALCDYFGYDRDELEELVEDRSGSSYVRYQRYISYDQRQGFEAYVEEQNAAFLKSEDPETRKNQIKGVWFEDDYNRKYPYGSLACNVIGFASADGSTGTGGVEQYYNDQLTGTNGREYGYLNDEADLERVIKPAENGNTLMLTIDANIQSVVEKYIKQWQDGIGSLEAAVIVMDPNTGEVLAMADSDRYDLNSPRTTEGFTDEEIYELGIQECIYDYRSKNPDAPKLTAEQVPELYDRSQIMSLGQVAAWNQIWRNFCVSDAYEPGSTQKIFTVAGALEEGVISPTDTFLCEGNLQFSGSGHTWRINCVNRNGHGPLDVTGGITNSCNVVMMEIALDEGEDLFLKYEHIFGFGETTGIDLPAEGLGLGLDGEIGRVDLATRSFGQNYTCTMIQMAAAYCSIINGGSYYKPHVVSRILDENGTIVKDYEPELVRETVSESTCDFIKNALFETVETGTGGAAAVAGYHVGGKTGTAEKLPRADENYLVSFCGYAPAEDPQLLCYVVIDQPDLVRQEQAHSSFASEIFSNIMGEILPMVGSYPEGVDGSEYRPEIALPETEGAEAGSGEGQTGESQSGETEETTGGSGEAATQTRDEDRESDSETQPETIGETRPPARDEYIQGDDGAGELPDSLTDIMIEAGMEMAEPEAETQATEADNGGITDIDSAPPS